MKFLVVGLGSMGRRRVNHLLRLKAGEIRGFDPHAERRKRVVDEFGIACFENFERAADWGPDAIVISTPPDDHLPYASFAARNRKHFFSELSINPDGLDDLSQTVSALPVVAAPSCTPRFNPIIQRIRSLVQDGTVGKPTNLTAYLGQYLPDWHPWEDYRHFFAAKRRTGACRELIAFDMLWFTWIFGDVASVSCMKAAVGGLESDIDDIYQILLRFKSATFCAMQVDAISRLPVRHYRIVLERGLIVWDWLTPFLRIYSADDGKWKEYSAAAGLAGYSVEDVYLDEIRAFLGAIRGEAPYPYSLSDDLTRLRVLTAVEESADQGVHVIV